MTLTTPAPERYTRFSCPNPHCARCNRPGEGNIAHRSWTGTHQHIERLRCTTCDREFSEREGTLMARSKLPEDTVIRLVACQQFVYLRIYSLRRRMAANIVTYGSCARPPP